MSYKPIHLLFLASVVAGMGHTVVFALLPLIGRELHFDEILINLLSAASAFLYFICSPRWGRLSDRIGRRKIIAMGLIGYFVATFVFNGFAQAGFAGAINGMLLYIFLLLSRSLQAAVLAASQPGAMAYIADITGPAQRTAGMSKLAAATGIGSMIGPALTLFTVFSLLAPLYIQATLALIVGVLVYRYLPDTNINMPMTPVAKLSYFDRRIRIYLIIGISMYTMMGVVQQTLAYYFQDLLILDTHTAAKTFGLSMFGSAAATLFVQIAIVQRVAIEPMKMLQLGLPLVVLAYVLMTVAHDEWTLHFAMVLFGAGMGLANPGFAAGASLQVGADEQGSVSGLVAAAPGLGFVIGPVLGAVLYQQHMRLPSLVAALVFVFLSLFAFRQSMKKS